MSVDRLVGRTTSFKGKRLYDILSRLKNFGVGRIVYRHVFNERYPEPSYYVITKVEPDMRDPTEKDPGKYKSFAYGERVFRGASHGNCLMRSCYKADWRLVAREDEQCFLARKVEPLPPRVVPSTAPFPPLMELLMRRQGWQPPAGEDESARPILQLRIGGSYNNRAVLDESAPDI